MKRVLIIYPHWPPSNLVGVHRVRLIANHLKSHGWQPLVLTVHESHYEEQSVPALEQLVDSSVEVIKVPASKAAKIFGRRVVGDLGLRSWKHLRLTAEKRLTKGDIHFIWFSIPSWYPPLMGPKLKRKFNVPFGVDYQDPWIHALPLGTSALSRAGLTQWAARQLEPRVLKHADLITAINHAYISGIENRHPELHHIPRATFQLGFDERDHQFKVSTSEFWDDDQIAFVYAGAFLPLSAPFHRTVFRAAKKAIEKGQVPNTLQFIYIGTGRPDQPIQKLAKEEGLHHHVQEHPERISFIEVQQILRSAQAPMVIGSPEAHYSASKVFQCILTGRPVFSVLHKNSEAATILKQCGLGQTLATFSGDLDKLEDNISKALVKASNPSSTTGTDLLPIAPFHAKKSALTLANAMNSIVTP